MKDCCSYVRGALSARRPSVRGIWRLSVHGARLTGSGQMLPSKEMVRKFEARKD